jgi:CubicO group peptidase (beta-lactamase class C family)
MRISKIENIAIVGVLTLLILSSVQVADGNSLLQSAVDYWPTDSWKSSTPQNEGMNSTRLAEMMNYLDNESALHPTGVLVVRNGYIILEEYVSTVIGQNVTQDMLSCTMSVISALVGVAISQGLLTLNQPVLEFFSGREIDNYVSSKDAITIEHLLTNTAGLDWEENTDPIQMRATHDWVQFILNKPMVRQPGTFFEYNSGLAYLLSVILENVTRMSTLEYAKSTIFYPLGITEYEWETDSQGIYDGGRGLKLTLRDMAKFGYLYLNNGSWNGNQIIPSSWISASSSFQVSVNNIKDYGYLWWIYRGTGIYNAVGFAVRAISVVPECGIVAVVSGYDSTGDFLRNQWLYALEEFVIQSAIDGPSSGEPVDVPLLVVVPVTLGVIAVTVFVVIKRRS